MKINILIRTSNRRWLFERCIQSIQKQTYKNIEVIVSTDRPVNYLPKWVKSIQVRPDYRHSFYWNLYCNALKESVYEGWFFFLDDDDYIESETAIEEAVKHLTNEEEGVIFQFKRGEIKKPNEEYIATKTIERGKIGMPCIFLHHTKKYIANFDGKQAADYRFIKEVSEKIDLKFIPHVIVKADRIGRGKCTL